MRRLQKKEKGTSEAKKLSMSKVEKERELRKAKAEKMSKAEKGKGVEKSKGKCKKGGDLAETRWCPFKAVENPSKRRASLVQTLCC